MDFIPPMIAPLDLANPPEDFFENPFPYYRELRETNPVASDGRGGVMVSRYADLAQIYRRHDIFVSDKRKEFAPKFGNGPLFRHHTTSLVFNDDPYHARVRNRLVGALSPRAVKSLELRLAQHCDDLVESWLTQGQADAIEAFAGAVPVRVISDLLGVPNEDRGQLRDWSLAILGALEPVLTSEQLQAGNDAVATFSDYLAELIAERRRYPGDFDTDLLTRLIHSEDAPLSEDELVHNAIFLLNAGHETTTNLIASALWIWSGLDELPVTDARICAAFIEEVLRCESPNQLGNRRTTVDIEIGGRMVPADTTITLVIGAANRDPAVFEDADRFDPGRSPNRHLAFGLGNHQCAGLSLARMEAQIALQAIGKRNMRPRLLAPPVRQRRVRFRGFASLPMTLQGLGSK